jgi:hypothetical protein
VRFVVASILAGAVIGACASFDTGENPTTSPDASSDTGAGSSSTSSSGATSDAGFVCPETGFCDDFTRVDVTDVEGPWTALRRNAGDPLPKIEDGAFHLFAAPVGEGAGESEQTRTYLLRELPSCAGLVTSVDFDFMLEAPFRNGNLSVISATDDKSVDHYTTLALTDAASIALVTGNNVGIGSAVVTVMAPAVDQWTHARLTYDALHQQVYARIGTTTVGPYPSDPVVKIASCRFTIGNDFIGHGPAASRRYDNVTAQVNPAP